MSTAQIYYYTPDLNLPDPEGFLDSDREAFSDSNSVINSVMELIWAVEDSDVPMLDQSGLDSNSTFGIQRGNHGEHTIGEFDPFFAQIFAPYNDPNENYISPPASMTVIDNLDSIVITQRDVDNDNVECAVCLDDMNVGDIGKQLSCSHRYHEDCIVPWLFVHTFSSRLAA